MAQLDTSVRGKKNGHARGALKARATDVLDDFVELRKDMSRLAEAANKAARHEVKHAGLRLDSIGKQTIRTAPPLLGEHSEAVLRDYGIAETQIAALIKKAVVHTGETTK